MWNRFRVTKEFQQPWLLRFFDQIVFHPVTGDELSEIRNDFPLGNYPLTIEHTQFDLAKNQRFLSENKNSIDEFSSHRQAAFDAELRSWKETGQFYFEQPEISEQATTEEIPAGMLGVQSPVDGSVWQINVVEGETVSSGQSLVLVGSMKMEIDVCAPQSGVIHQILHQSGSLVNSGQPLVILDPPQSAQDD